MKFRTIPEYLLIGLIVVAPHTGVSQIPFTNPFSIQESAETTPPANQELVEDTSYTRSTEDTSAVFSTYNLNSVQQRYSRLVVREEVPISRQTFLQLWQDATRVLRGDNATVQQVKESLEIHFSGLEYLLNLMVALFIAGIIVFVYRPVKQYLKTVRDDFATRKILAITTAGYILEILLRVLPTLFVTFGIWVTALILQMPPQINQSIFHIAAAVVIYKFSRWLLEILFAPDETRHRLLPCNTRIAKYFSYLARVLLQWTLLYVILLVLLRFLQLHENVIHLIQFVYRVGAIVIFSLLFARRDFTLSLFPETQNKIYRRLLRISTQIYYPIYLILVFSGLLSVLGYVKLSGFILSRVFYTIAVILLGILVNRILYDALNWILPEKKRKSRDEEDRAARFWERVYTVAQFISSAVLLIIGIFLIAKIWWLLGEQSIGESILSVFTFRLFYVQDTPITIWSLIKAILIFALFLYVSRVVRNFLKSSVLQKTKLDVGARHAVLTITHYIILVIGLVVAVESVGIQLTTLKIFAGALGLGIGFGLQNIANNFASGLIILFERPIKSKDFVQVGEILGTVTRISARSTTILTRDNIAIIVPNSDFIEKTVVNWSLDNTPTRVHVPIGVEYGTDPEWVREVLLDIADAHPRVLAIPRPRIWFKEFGESSLDFELLIWINDPQEGVNNIKSDINFQIHQAFQEKGIRIPFPQRDMHLKIDNQTDIEVLRAVFSGQSSQQRTGQSGGQELHDNHPEQDE